MSINKLKNRMSSIDSVYKITNAMKLISAASLKNIQKKFDKITEKNNIITSHLSNIITNFGFSFQNNIIQKLFNQNIDAFQANNIMQKYFNFEDNYSINGYLKYQDIDGDSDSYKSIMLDNPKLFKVIKNTFPKIQIVFSADRGLCGSFFSKFFNSLEKDLSSNSSEPLKDEIKKDILFITNSKKFVNKLNLQYKNNNILYVEDSFINITAFLSLFFSGNGSQVKYAYSSFINTMKSKYQNQNISNIKYEKTTAIFDVSEDNLKEYIILYIKHIMKFSQAHNILCENSARLVAMDAASTNAGEFYDDVKLEYYNFRQSSVTNELIEIISAAEVLS